MAMTYTIMWQVSKAILKTINYHCTSTSELAQGGWIGVCKSADLCLFFAKSVYPPKFLFKSETTTTSENRSVKPRPNDCNMPTQHIATLLGATCCVRLATVLRCVATCWLLLAQVWNWSNLSQQHPTCRNTSQHVGQMDATCCTQQCCDMLRWHVVIVWPGLYVLQVHAPMCAR